jgi:hypothetical protein
MSRDCGYSDRNTVAERKAVKKRSTGVKFCKRVQGGFNKVERKSLPFDFAQGRLSRRGREKWGTQ